MDRSAAQQYMNTLIELYAALRNAKTHEERLPIAMRMHNIVQPLFVVDTYAAQHIVEAAHNLNHAQVPIVNASIETIRQSLARLEHALENHPHEHFVLYGPGERLFVKPVAGDELHSLVEKGRLIHHEHEHFVRALDAPPAVARVMIEADADTLRPMLTRLGFPNADALAFFTSRAHPTLGVPAEQMPSILVCTLRAGVPVRIVKHRSLL